MVGGVASLNDFKPHSLAVKGPKARWDAAEHRFQPQLTIDSGNTPYLFVGPDDAATIYNAPNSFNVNLPKNQTQYDGTGVTIGLVGDSPFSNDSFFYRSFFGLPSASVTDVIEGDPNNLALGADQTEAILDSEVSGALVPGANIAYYTAGDTVFQAGIFLAIYRAIDDNNVGILSVSFGGCEASQGVSGNLQILNAWGQAAAQGIAVTVSSGDSGSAGCDNQNTEPIATQGFAVNGLASTPYNIAVGGTDFDVLPGKFSTYVSQTNNANYTSALNYIPENPWNDSTVGNGPFSSNIPQKNSSGTNIIAGGGGISSLGTTSTAGTQVGYAKPAWQKGFAASDSDSVRDLPDVSLLAGNGSYRALWAVCLDGDCSSGASSTISGVGGTSAAAPAMAGILALVNQKLGPSVRLGQPNWVLYKLAQTSPSAFHGITTGNNSAYCQAASADCGSNSFLTGYDAGSSYNLATGLGSIDIINLINNWSSPSLKATKNGLTLDKTTFAHGTSIDIGVQVNPSSATGDVAIVNNAETQNQGLGGLAPTRLTLAGGAASGTYSEFPGGTYNVYANYGGDGTFAGSASEPVQVTVTPEDSVLLLEAESINSSNQIVNAAGGTFSLGSFISLTAQPVGKSESSKPNPPANASGNVTFTDSFNGGQGPNSLSTILDSTGNAEWIYPYWQAGTHSITAQYSGDLSYNASSAASPVSFTVNKAASAISLTTSVTSIAYGSFFLAGQVTANMPVSSYPIGGTLTVTNTTNSTVVLTTQLDGGGGCTKPTEFCAYFSTSIPVSQLVSGVNTFTASYSGDANFSGSGPSATATITCTANCASPSGQSINISFSSLSNGPVAPGGTITSNVSVYSATGFAGLANLTCSITGQNSGDSEIPTCAFAPTQLTVSSNATTSVLTISTTAATSARMTTPHLRPEGSNHWYAAGGTVFAAVILFGIPARRRTLRRVTGLVVVIAALTAISSCGGGGSSGGTPPGGGNHGNPGTTADTYTVTFKAADAKTGTVSAQDYFTFVVN